jgi:predicted dehydrogenase
MSELRVAVVGAGAFGKNHARAIVEIPGVRLAGILDADASKSDQLARHYQTRCFRSIEDVLSTSDCAVVATPTITHEQVACELLCRGLDVLVEKPIADSAKAGRRMSELASERGRILQVGHLERFNPAVIALQSCLTLPIFFEVHRLSVFTPRSLDIDVVLDLMIHDLDIVLSLTGAMPVEVRAAGISVLTPLVDIANVRLSFESGCIANLTASRVSTEKVRKLRVFQPGEYISVDYGRQDAVRLAVRKNEPNVGFESQIDYRPLPVTPGEPLKLELESFFQAVRTRTQPVVTAAAATDALRLAESILAKIREHGELVSETIRRKSR